MHNSPCRVLTGPRPALPPKFFATVNGGESAFSVFAHDVHQARARAHDRLVQEIIGACDPNDPFAMDTAAAELAAVVAQLDVMPEKEWDRRCLAMFEAQRQARHGGAA